MLKKPFAFQIRKIKGVRSVIITTCLSAGLLHSILSTFITAENLSIKTHYNQPPSSATTKFPASFLTALSRENQSRHAGISGYNPFFLVCVSRASCVKIFSSNPQNPRNLSRRAGVRGSNLRPWRLGD